MLERKPEQLSQSVFELKGVPALRQQHDTWCGITSLAMVMNYWGQDKTPEGVFEDIYYPGVYNANHESLDPVQKPTYEKFALHIKKMSTQPPLAPLTARVMDYSSFEKLKKGGHTPRSILRHFIVDRETPCIIRTPRHSMVVRGIDFEHERYLVNNPTVGKEDRGFLELEAAWSSGDDSTYHRDRDTRYLMLLIYPQVFDKQK